MSFDASRFFFDPTRDYLGVVMQQGRVQLDSDWNEWLMELLRRLQAGTMDLVGRTGVPATTPSGFKINAYSVGTSLQISIGCGRIYVDGLLAENHGAAAQSQWDPALAEYSAAPQLPNTSEVDVDYTQQPYYSPGALSAAQNAGKQYLVYLDVWQRDVSAVQDTNLIDPAVGIETTARRQTVWQVKLLDVTTLEFTGVTPDAPIAGLVATDPAIAPWAALLQPSGALLTNGTGGAQITAQTACALSPTSGYTGLENQLYRVEVHQVTPATATVAASATFKWSRENGSVVTLVTGIATLATNGASQLTVQSLGRDQVLGFTPGDWVEITDDILELSGLAGELHLITTVEPQGRTITLDSAVSAANFPVSGNLTDARRHTRVRRWDQSGAVYFSDGSTIIVDLDQADASGSLPGTKGIPIPPSGTALLLESGITVAFDLARSGGFFQPGDFWTFAARTADSSIQTLTAAAPQGPHHHYARLATVDFAFSPPVVTDCRRVMPSLASEVIHVTNVLVGAMPLVNDATFTIQALISNGISIVCDAPIDSAIITHVNPNNPICTVSIDFPSVSNEGAFTRTILPSTVSIGPLNTIQWKSAIAANAVTPFENQIPLAGPAVLGRLSVKGSAVWALTNPNVFLNGANTGRPSGDLDLWFWLISQPIATLNVSLLQFGQQPVGQASAAQVVTLYNNSTTAPLTIKSITIAGTGATPAANSGFTQNNAIGTSLPAATAAGPSSGNINVIFTPTTANPTTPSTAQLSVLTNTAGVDNNQLLVSLSGTGVAPALAASVASLVFPPNTIVGTTPPPMTITLKSTGSSQVILSGISIIPPASAVFFLSNLPPVGQALQPGGSVDILVSFRPPATSAPGTFSAQVSIVSSAGSPLNIPISAVSIAGTPVLSLSTTQAAFGPVTVGRASTLPVTLTNTGNAVMNINGVPITGLQPGAFSVSATPAVLQPTQQATFVITFLPQSIGSFTAQLQILSNAVGVMTVALSGSGKAQKVSKEGKEREGKFVLETVVGKVPERVQQARAAMLSGGGPVIAPQAGAATQHAFITPQERPEVGPQAVEPEPEKPSTDNGTPDKTRE